MSSQLEFLLHQAAQYIQSNNFQSAVLLLKQILRIKPRHFLALRMMAVAYAQQNLNANALECINKAIDVDGRNAIAYSNKGNILQNLGLNSEAVDVYHKAIRLDPTYAEAYGNLANAQQGLHDYENAVKNYQIAITKNPLNPDFYCNLGNCLSVADKDQEAHQAYTRAIELQPYHADAYYFLAQLKLRNMDFSGGWDGLEWRWRSRGFNSYPLKTSKKVWDGKKISGSLFVWGEQGIGDQILYASMLNDVCDLADSVTVSVDAKLIPILERSFPHCHIVDRLQLQSEEGYDSQIPIGSIGQYFKNSIEDFKRVPIKYLVPNDLLVRKFKESPLLFKKINCGISWKSSNPTVGMNKSIALENLSSILNLKENINFINLQYGDVQTEIDVLKRKLGVDLLNVPDLDLFDDLDGTLALIEACDIIVTTSNSTAHMSGAVGKETLLLLPYSSGKFWYWHDIDRESLWYPSIKIFRQKKQGDWSHPVSEVSEYLEKRFAI